MAMAKELILSLTVRKEGNRYWAWCPELDVSSEGKTTEDARDNLREAVQCHIETMIEQGDMELLLRSLGSQEVNWIKTLSSREFYQAHSKSRFQSHEAPEDLWQRGDCPLGKRGFVIRIGLEQG